MLVRRSASAAQHVLLNYTSISCMGWQPSSRGRQSANVQYLSATTIAPFSSPTTTRAEQHDDRTDHGNLVFPSESQTLTLAARQLAQIHRSDYFERRVRHTNRIRQELASLARVHQESEEDLMRVRAREKMSALIHELRSLSPAKALLKVKEAAIGRQSLAELLAASDEARIRAGVDIVYLSVLAHFIIAEGEVETLWRWIETMLAASPLTWKPASRAAHADKVAWIGRLVGHIVGVHMARDVHQSADEGITVLLRLRELQRTLPPARSISAGASTVHIGRAITAEKCSQTDPTLYDQFIVAAQGHWERGSLRDRFEHLLPQDQLHVALHVSYHPKSPSADLMLLFLRRIENDDGNRMWHPTQANEAYFQRNVLQYLQSHLRSRGRVQEVDWVHRLVETRLPAARTRIAQRESQGSLATESTEVKGKHRDFYHLRLPADTAPRRT